ncbi:MAG: hypothetical protein EBR15_06160, partial [Gammaproteobacteria bacterium]|nr:hypothetical protein [Gammaproteobacteria bacterium]
MSLILDALKKSEGARLRSDHPAMFESPVARPRATRPRWLSGLVAMQESGSSEEFLESVRLDLFPDKVYVF